MKTRKSGNSSLEVSALGMGCMNLSFGTGKAFNITTGVNVVPALVFHGFIVASQSLRPHNIGHLQFQFKACLFV